MQNHIKLNNALNISNDHNISLIVAQVVNILNRISQNKSSQDLIKIKHKKRRKKFLIETFPLSVRKLVDVMIEQDNFTYQDIQNNLKLMGYTISENAIYNYKKYLQGGK